MFYGVPGIGKTTFVNEMYDGKVLFISTDRGTRFLDTMRHEVSNFQDVLDVVAALRKPGAVKPYSAICLDHIDDICSMCESHILAKHGIEALSELEWGAGWKEFRTTLNNTIKALMSLGPALAFIAHEETKEIADGVLSVTRTQPSMPKTAWKLLVPSVDIIAYLYFKRVKTPGKKSTLVRSITTQATPTLYVKDRTPRVDKSDMPLDGKAFRDSFSAVKKAGVGSTRKKKTIARRNAR